LWWSAQQLTFGNLCSKVVNSVPNIIAGNIVLIPCLCLRRKMDIRSLVVNHENDELAKLVYIAGSNPNNWEFMRSCRLVHNSFGEGSITGISGPDRDGLTISVLFNNRECQEEKRFLDSAFSRDYFTILNHPDYPLSIQQSLEVLDCEIENIKKKIHTEEEARKKEKEKQQRVEEERQAQLIQKNEQQSKEKNDRKEFYLLKSKYEVDCPDTSPTSQLFMILLKMDNCENLDLDDQKFLNENRLFGLLGLFFERCYKTYPSDLWPLIKAISNWRKAGKPEIALLISEGSATSENRSQSALLTSRGGAFRDLKDFKNAIENAKSAIKLTPKDYHPYNLLGAILYQTGEPEEADKQFNTAIELGALPREVDNQIRNSVKLAEVDQQRVVAEYLIKKDPIKFKWAAYYLRD
jgi:tetratricopeptide (TPR) repeat protein